MTRKRIAVLASGGGSNLQALIEHLRGLGEERAADIVLVAADRPEARALQRAALAGIDATVVASKFAPFGRDLNSLLAEHNIDLVVLAGYLQLVPFAITERYRGRMLNVHPAPLPEFGGKGMYGERLHKAVLAAKEEASASTVHFVDDRYDHGAVIASHPVPIRPGDDAAMLASRVLRVEHALFPRVVQAVASGDVTLGADNEVHFARPGLFDLPPT